MAENGTRNLCLEPVILLRKAFIPNYGFILLGITCGFFVGLLFVLLLLCCLRRNASTRKYILYTDKIEDEADGAELLCQASPYKNIAAPCLYKQFQHGNKEETRVRRFPSLRSKSNVNQKAEVVQEFYEWCLSMVIDNRLHETPNLIDSFIFDDHKIDDININRESLIFALMMQSKVISKKIFESGNINAKRKEKFDETINSGLSQFISSFKLGICDESGSTMQIRLATSIHQIYQFLQSEFENMLSDFKLNLSSKTSSVDEPKKDQGKLLLKNEKNAYKNLFNESMLLVLEKIIALQEDLSAAQLERHFHFTENCTKFILLQKFYPWFYQWVNAETHRLLDNLKVKKLINDHMYNDFQSICEYELELAITHMQKEVVTITKNVEYKHILSFNKEMKALYELIKNKLSSLHTPPQRSDKLSSLHAPPQRSDKLSSLYAPAHRSGTTHEKTEESISIQIMQDFVTKKINLLEKLSEIFEDVQVALIELIETTIRIFLSRLQSRSQDAIKIHIEVPEPNCDNSSVNGAVDKVRELTDNQAVHQMCEKLKHGTNTVMNQLLHHIEQNQKVARDHILKIQNHVSQVQSAGSTDVNRSMYLIIFRCLLKNHCPMTWNDCEKILNEALKFYFCFVLGKTFRGINNQRVSNLLEKYRNHQELNGSKSNLVKKLDNISQSIRNSLNIILKLYIKSVKANHTLHHIPTLKDYLTETVESSFKKMETIHEQEKLFEITMSPLCKLLKQRGDDIKKFKKLEVSLNNFMKQWKKVFKTYDLRLEPDVKRGIQHELNECFKKNEFFIDNFNFNYPKYICDKRDLTNQLYWTRVCHEILEKYLDRYKGCVNEVIKLYSEFKKHNIFEAHIDECFLKGLQGLLLPLKFRKIHNVMTVKQQMQ